MSLIRHRTTKTKGCFSRQIAMATTHQLMLSARKKRRRLDGQNHLPEIIEAVEFRDGIKHEIKAARSNRHQLFTGHERVEFDLVVKR
jgi:putative transposase